MSTTQCISILETSEFDVFDFHRRWQRARLSALLEFLPQCSEQMLFSLSAAEEAQWLELLPIEKRDDFLRRVFEQSRKLALSVTRYFGLTWELSDIYQVLELSESPCVGHVWQKHNDAMVLKREGCAFVNTLGAFYCDYWREAVDGLVTGVGETERFSRHGSLGHQDSYCLDVLYQESSTKQRWGAVPSHLVASLERIQKQFLSQKMHLSLEGFAEQTLYYRLESQGQSLCGAGGDLLHDAFKQEVQKSFPGIQIQDVSPRAVIASET